MNIRITAFVYAAVAFSTVVLCGARTRREVYMEKQEQVKDLQTSASGAGYIYRTDGENPPVFIKLGEGKNEKFDAILENFKKENGFHGMPVNSGKPASPYQIPVLGQEKRTVGYDHSGQKKSNLHFGDDLDDGKYESVLENMDDLDELAPITDDNHSEFGNEDHSGLDNHGGFGNLGGFGFGDLGGISSPFKYHHDVSATEGMKGDSFGFDDQNYYGSPYTHNEYKSPGKHAKAGGSFHKAGHYFSEGSAADSGFKNHHDYDKGHAGKYGKDDLKSHYKKAAGHKSGHANEADHFGKHHSTAHGVKGNKFGETESHKKGQKTTGFHNVYHKDEYNKEQKFYEDQHKHGKHDKYGGKHKDFTQKGAGHKHGHKHDSGFDEGHKGEVGHFDKGNYYDAQKGHSGETGHKSHHSHKADYDQLSDNKKYGEHEVGGGGGGGGGGSGYDFY